MLALPDEGWQSIFSRDVNLARANRKRRFHLAYLRNAGLVRRRDGKWIYYNIQRPADAAVERILSVTIDSIASVKVDGKFHLLTENRPARDEFVEGSDDIYAETYETEYEPNEMEIFLL